MNSEEILQIWTQLLVDYNKKNKLTAAQGSLSGAVGKNSKALSQHLAGEKGKKKSQYTSTVQRF